MSSTTDTYEMVLKAKDEASQVFRQVRQEVSQLGASLGSVGSALSFGQARPFMGASMSGGQVNPFFGLTGGGLGLGGLGLTAPVAGIAGSAIGGAMSLQTNMNIIQAATGATAEQMKGLQEESLKLGDDLKLPGVSANDAAKGMRAMAQAGVDLQNTMAAQRGVMQLAIVDMQMLGKEHVDTALSAQTVTAALRAFQMDGTQATAVADALVAILTHTNTTLAELKNAIAEGGALWRVFQADVRGSKGSMDDFAATLLIMTQNGMSASMAGTELRRAMGRLVMPEVQTFLQELGVKITNSKGQLLSWRDIILNLNKVTADMTPIRRDAAFEKIFGQRGDAVAAMVIQPGVSGFDKASEQVTTLGGAERMAAAEANGLEGSLKSLSAAWEALMTRVGTPFLGQLRDITLGVGEVINQISDLSPAVLQNAMTFGLLVAAIGPVLGILTMLVSPIGLITVALASLAVAFAQNMGGIANATRVAVESVIPYLMAIGKEFIGVVQAAAPAAAAIVQAFAAIAGGIGRLALGGALDQPLAALASLGRAALFVAAVYTTVMIPALLSAVVGFTISTAAALRNAVVLGVNVVVASLTASGAAAMMALNFLRVAAVFAISTAATVVYAIATQGLAGAISILNGGLLVLAANAVRAGVALVASLLPISLPVLAVIAAVGLLAAAWMNNWGDIQGKTEVVVGFIKDLIGNLIGFIGDRLADLHIIPPDWRQRWEHDLVEPVKNAATQIGQHVSNISKLASGQIALPSLGGGDLYHTRPDVGGMEGSGPGNGMSKFQREAQDSAQAAKALTDNQNQLANATQAADGQFEAMEQTLLSFKQATQDTIKSLIDIKVARDALSRASDLAGLQVQNIQNQERQLEITYELDQIDNQRKLNDLKRQGLDLDSKMIPLKAQMAVFDLQIQQAERPHYDLVAQDIRLQQQLLPFKQQIAQIDDQINYVTDKRLELERQEQMILSDQASLGDRQHLNAIQTEIARQSDLAGNLEDEMSPGYNPERALLIRARIAQLKGEEYGAKVSLYPTEDTHTAVQNEMDRTKLQDDSTKNLLGQQRASLDLLQHPLAQALLSVKNLEDAYKLETDASVNGLNAQKQKLIDLLTPMELAKTVLQGQIDLLQNEQDKAKLSYDSQKLALDPLLLQAQQYKNTIDAQGTAMDLLAYKVEQDAIKMIASETGYNEATARLFLSSNGILDDHLSKLREIQRAWDKLHGQAGGPTDVGGGGATFLNPSTGNYEPVQGTANSGITRHPDEIATASAQTGVPQDVIAAIQATEGSGDTAISPAGAMGPMQVMPFHFKAGENGLDIQTNISRGAQVLADNYARFGNWDSAAAAYFGAVDSHGNPTTATDAGGMNGINYVKRFEAARRGFQNPEPNPNVPAPLTPEQIEAQGTQPAVNSEPVVAEPQTTTTPAVENLPPADQIDRITSAQQAQSDAIMAQQDALASTIERVVIENHEDGLRWEHVFYADGHNDYQQLEAAPPTSAEDATQRGAELWPVGSEAPNTTPRFRMEGSDSDPWWKHRVVIDWPQSEKKDLPGYAAGGPIKVYDGSHPMITGEKGPEVILPTASGNVITNEQLATLNTSLHSGKMISEALSMATHAFMSSASIFPSLGNAAFSAIQPLVDRSMGGLTIDTAAIAASLGAALMGSGVTILGEAAAQGMGKVLDERGVIHSARHISPLDLVSQVTRALINATSDLPDSSRLESRHMGGSLDASQPYLVGERGPEIIMPHGSGYVLDAAETRNIDPELLRNLHGGPKSRRLFDWPRHGTMLPTHDLPGSMDDRGYAVAGNGPEIVTPGTNNYSDSIAVVDLLSADDSYDNAARATAANIARRGPSAEDFPSLTPSVDQLSLGAGAPTNANSLQNPTLTSDIPLTGNAIVANPPEKAITPPKMPSLPGGFGGGSMGLPGGMGGGMPGGGNAPGGIGMMRVPVGPFSVAVPVPQLPTQDVTGITYDPSQAAIDLNNPSASVIQGDIANPDDEEDARNLQAYLLYQFRQDHGGLSPEEWQRQQDAHGAAYALKDLGPIDILKPPDASLPEERKAYDARGHTEGISQEEQERVANEERLIREYWDKINSGEYDTRPPVLTTGGKPASKASQRLANNQFSPEASDEEKALFIDLSKAIRDGKILSDEDRQHLNSYTITQKGKKGKENETTLDYFKTKAGLEVPIEPGGKGVMGQPLNRAYNNAINQLGGYRGFPGGKWQDSAGNLHRFDSPQEVLAMVKLDKRLADGEISAWYDTDTVPRDDLRAVPYINTRSDKRGKHDFKPDFFVQDLEGNINLVDEVKAAAAIAKQEEVGGKKGAETGDLGWHVAKKAIGAIPHLAEKGIQFQITTEADLYDQLAIDPVTGKRTFAGLAGVDWRDIPVLDNRTSNLTGKGKDKVAGREVAGIINNTSAQVLQLVQNLQSNGASESEIHNLATRYTRDQILKTAELLGREHGLTRNIVAGVDFRTTDDIRADMPNGPLSLGELRQFWPEAADLLATASKRGVSLGSVVNNNGEISSSLTGDAAGIELITAELGLLNESVKPIMSFGDTFGNSLEETLSLSGDPSAIATVQQHLADIQNAAGDNMLVTPSYSVHEGSGLSGKIMGETVTDLSTSTIEAINLTTPVSKAKSDFVVPPSVLQLLKEYGVTVEQSIPKNTEVTNFSAEGGYALVAQRRRELLGEERLNGAYSSSNTKEYVDEKKRAKARIAQSRGQSVAPAVELPQNTPTIADLFGVQVPQTQSKRGRGVTKSGGVDYTGMPQKQLASLAQTDPDAAAALFAQRGITEVSQLADEYAQQFLGHSLDQQLFVNSDVATQEAIADWYEHAQDNPDDPQVQSAYAQMKKEVNQQFDFLVQHGYKFEPYGAAFGTGDEEAYSSSAAMIADIRDNKHLNVFDAGDPHSLLNGEDNWKFRAVHDVFGHAASGFQFGAKGEENAWIAHSQMFSDEAAKAMTTETRGQNSWVNFGPFGEQNRANPENTIFAQQKAVILPDWARIRGGTTVKRVSGVNASGGFSNEKVDIHDMMQGSPMPNADVIVSAALGNPGRELTRAIGLNPDQFTPDDTEQIQAAHRSVLEALGYNPETNTLQMLSDLGINASVVGEVAGTWQGGAEPNTRIMLHQPTASQVDMVTGLIGRAGLQDAVGITYLTKPEEGDTAVLGIRKPDGTAWSMQDAAAFTDKYGVALDVGTDPGYALAIGYGEDADTFEGQTLGKLEQAGINPQDVKSSRVKTDLIGFNEYGQRALQGASQTGASLGNLRRAGYDPALAPALDSLRQRLGGNLPESNVTDLDLATGFRNGPSAQLTGRIKPGLEAIGEPEVDPAAILDINAKGVATMGPRLGGYHLWLTSDGSLLDVSKGTGKSQYDPYTHGYSGEELNNLLGENALGTDTSKMADVMQQKGGAIRLNSTGSDPHLAAQIQGPISSSQLSTMRKLYDEMPDPTAYLQFAPGVWAGTRYDSSQVERVQTWRDFVQAINQRGLLGMFNLSSPPTNTSGVVASGGSQSSSSSLGGLNPEQAYQNELAKTGGLSGAPQAPTANTLEEYLKWYANHASQAGGDQAGGVTKSGGSGITGLPTTDYSQYPFMPTEAEAALAGADDTIRQVSPYNLEAYGDKWGGRSLFALPSGSIYEVSGHPFAGDEAGSALGLSPDHNEQLAHYMPFLASSGAMRLMQTGDTLYANAFGWDQITDQQIRSVATIMRSLKLPLRWGIDHLSQEPGFVDGEGLGNFQRAIDDLGLRAAPGASEPAQPAPGFAQGGFVNPVSGGHHVVVGEAGEREYILPESKLKRLMRDGSSAMSNLNLGHLSSTGQFTSGGAMMDDGAAVDPKDNSTQQQAIVEQTKVLAEAIQQDQIALQVAVNQGDTQAINNAQKLMNEHQSALMLLSNTHQPLGASDIINFDVPVEIPATQPGALTPGFTDLKSWSDAFAGLDVGAPGGEGPGGAREYNEHDSNADVWYQVRTNGQGGFEKRSIPPFMYPQFNIIGPPGYQPTLEWLGTKDWLTTTHVAPNFDPQHDQFVPMSWTHHTVPAAIAHNPPPDYKALLAGIPTITPGVASSSGSSRSGDTNWLFTNPMSPIQNPANTPGFAAGGFVDPASIWNAATGFVGGLFGNNQNVPEESLRKPGIPAMPGDIAPALKSYGWSDEAIAWYLENVPTRLDMPLAENTEGVTSILTNGTTKIDIGHSVMAKNDGEYYAQTLQHEAQHAWENTHGLNKEVDLQDWSMLSAQTQGLGGTMSFAQMRAGMDPQHFDIALAALLGYDFSALPEWYRQKHFGFMGASLTAPVHGEIMRREMEGLDANTLRGGGATVGLYAEGGDISDGELAVVGERGWELMEGPGSITSHTDAKDAIASAVAESTPTQVQQQTPAQPLVLQFNSPLVQVESIDSEERADEVAELVVQKLHMGLQQQILSGSGDLPVTPSVRPAP